MPAGVVVRISSAFGSRVKVGPIPYMISSSLQMNAASSRQTQLAVQPLKPSDVEGSDRILDPFENAMWSKAL